MKRRWVLLGALLCALVVASSAGADPFSYFGSGKPAVSGQAPKPNGPPVSVGSGPAARVQPGGFTGRHCISRAGRKTCHYYKKGLLAKQCVTRGKRSTCTYYNAKGRPYKVCLRKRPGAKARCHRVSGGSFLNSAWAQGPPAKLPLGLIHQGYTNPLIGAVGAIWLNARQWCSGTLIARGVVLTAGHCVYANASDSNCCGYYTGDLVFSPGQTWSAGTTLPYSPYGDWIAKQWWTTQGFADNDPGMDWGLIELYPDANGNYPGDFTGTFLAMGDIRWNAGAPTLLLGYPVTGVFGGDDYHYGLGQWFCNTSWDGATLPIELSGSNVMLAHSCSMTGGSSGGPVFVQLSDGSWVIGGVNDKADILNFGTSSAYADWMFSDYFDSRLPEFFHAVFG